jgi:hypothetical protein
MNTPPKPALRPALVVIDVHDVRVRIAGKNYEMFFPPKGEAKEVGFGQGARLPSNEGILRTVRLMEAAKENGIPIIATTFKDNPVAKYEIAQKVRETLKGYGNSKQMRRGHPFLASELAFLEFLNRYCVDSLILCGGERNTCVLYNAEWATENEIGIIASMDAIYRNRNGQKFFGDQDVVHFDDHIRARYKRCIQYDPNSKAFMDGFVTDIRNLKWFAGALENAEIRNPLDRHGFGEMLEWARDMLGNLEGLIRHDQDVARACENYDLSAAPGGLIGFETVSSFYAKNCEMHENVGTLIERISGK